MKNYEFWLSQKELDPSLKEELLQHIEAINGINFLASEINLDANTIKNLAFELGNKVDNLFVYRQFHGKNCGEVFE